MIEMAKQYSFTYTFTCEAGCTPEETLDQEFYDITSNNDSISLFGTFERVKKGSKR